METESMLPELKLKPLGRLGLWKFFAVNNQRDMVLLSRLLNSENRGVK